MAPGDCHNQPKMLQYHFHQKNDLKHMVVPLFYNLITKKSQ